MVIPHHQQEEEPLFFFLSFLSFYLLISTRCALVQPLLPLAVSTLLRRRIPVKESVYLFYKLSVGAVTASSRSFYASVRNATGECVLPKTCPTQLVHY